MQKIKDDELPRFVDRWTIEYVRTFRHPIERVWRSITDPKEFTAWFIPGSIELEAGGAYSFGGTEPDFSGRVIAIDPPCLIRFSGGPGSESSADAWFQFELSDSHGQTRMVFTQHFASDVSYSEAPEEYLGGDLPVRGAPWRPGVVGGWHDIFNAMQDHLAGRAIGSLLPPSDLGKVAKYWAHEHRRMGEFSAEQVERYARLLRVYENYYEMSAFYRDYIRQHCPHE